MPQIRQNLIEPLRQDVRYALRMLRRSPGFTLVAVLSLALGIGANTAIFTLINAVMLRMLPVRDPAGLVELLQHYPGEPRGNGYWSWASYAHYRDHNDVFSGLIGAAGPARLNVRGSGFEAGEVNGQSVTGNFFSELGLKPALGRLIGPNDKAGVAVLGWSFWKNRFNQDPAILGRSIVVQDVPVTVIGIAPPDFSGLLVGSRTEVWSPLTPSPAARLALIARLRPGVSIEQARAEMAVLYRFTIEERASTSKDPLVRRLRVEVEPAAAGLSLLRDQFEKPLVVLMVLVGLILLIACTNIAGLLLARGAARQKEMAVRAALGASRFRVVCQVLTESVMLSLAGGIAGVVLAYCGARTLVRILTSGRPIIGLAQPLDLPLTPDLHVLLFTGALALLTASLFGVAPAWSALTSAPAAFLTQSGRSGETPSRRLFGRGLVVAQVALSVTLLSAAGLFVRHLANLRHVDLGFRRDHVLLVALDPSQSGYDPARLALGFEDLLGRLGRMPGVRSASLSGPTPLSGAGASGFATAEGYQERPEDRRYISIAWIAPKYFETLGTPLLAGRDFGFADQDRPVAMINQALARRYFARRDPIGKHVTLDHVTGDRERRTYEVVGVSGDAKYYEIREPAPATVYLPAFQNGRVNARTFLLRTYIDPDSVAAEVRGTVREVLTNVPVARMTTLTEQVDATIVPERLMAALSGAFGALGAALAAIGLYGLLAYTVARRITEFGIRLALGATGRDLVRMVAGEALKLLAAGIAIGTPVALAGRKLASGFVQDVGISGPAPIVFGAAAMLSLALAAAWLPARKAARVDPMEALRHE